MTENENIELIGTGNGLNRTERETIITFNETNDPAEIFTYSPTLIRKLDALANSRESVECYKVEVVGGVTSKSYRIPKKWIKVTAPRVLTDEQRKELSERARRNLNRKDV